MAQYYISKIAGVSGGKFAQKHNPGAIINYLLTDSRKVLHPSTSLFFAIKTSSNDGHNYIQGLYKSGVRNFIVSVFREEYKQMDTANFILVDDVITALQDIAAFHRTTYNGKVIGITGSNGKTVVKEWLHHMLHDNKNVFRSPRSYNSQIGVALSLWLGNSSDDIIIIEAGISKPGEMEKLAGIIQPDIGIITNIRQAHQENFTGLEEKAAEKIRLFAGSRTIIYCSDHPEVSGAVKKHCKSPVLFSWSMHQHADLQISKIIKSTGKTSFQALYAGDTTTFSIPFSDDASIENSIHCIATMLHLNYKPEMIKEKLHSLFSLNMRMELKEGINNCMLINDAYSSDLDSLLIALDFLSQQNKDRKKTVILSDILQSGLVKEKLYHEVNTLLEQHNIDTVIGIGDVISSSANKFSMKKYFYHSTEEFLKYHILSNFRNESILIKGARIFGFELISRALGKKSHETMLEINLNAMVSNLNYYKSKLGPGCRIMAMVKAFSYGSGSHEIASLMQFHNVDYLAVAYTDEGIELRKSGILLPIMVMSPEARNFESVFEFNLEPEIFSIPLLRNLVDYIISSERDRTFPVHIKLDTGMHRLGVCKNELEDLIDILQQYPQIEVKSIFSHLAGSDDPLQDDFTRYQISLFDELSRKIEDSTGKKTIRHILNSGGINRFPEAHFDMVRAGIGLYGFSNDAGEQKKLINTSTFKTKITQVKKLAKGETVGYNRMWQSGNDSRIAVVPVGYADGLSRKLGNGQGNMLINGQPATIIGDVCMDMCMLDVSDIEAYEGDEVIIFGEGLPASEIATSLGTITYEILTGISGRVKRIYIFE